MSAAQVMAILDESEPVRRSPPTASPGNPAGRAISCRGVGSVLAPAAQAIQVKVQAPIAISAQSVLAAATLVAQAHADVELPTGQTRPLSSFFIT